MTGRRRGMNGKRTRRGWRGKKKASKRGGTAGWPEQPAPGVLHQRAGGAKNEQASSGNELSAGRDQRQLDLPLASIGLAAPRGAPEGYGQNGRPTDHRGLHRLQFRAALILWPFLPERDEFDHSHKPLESKMAVHSGGWQPP